MPPKAAKGGKGEGKKKKKKLTKKEIAELERKEEEEKRRREEEERQRLLEEQRLREEGERRRLEEEERKRREEAERLQEEEKQITAWKEDRWKALNEIWRKEYNAQDWGMYVQCRLLPDPHCESHVNTFLSTSEEVQYRDVPALMTTIQDIEKLAKEMDELYLLNAEREAHDIRRIAEQSRALRALIKRHTDATTAHIIQHADEYANAKNEVQMGRSSMDFKLGLWVNIAKFPKTKSVEFPELSLFTDLPKTLALQSVAIRFFYVKHDPFMDLYPSPYLTLGGVLLYELLALPAPARHVKGWTLRQVTSLASKVQRKSYPIAPEGGDPSQAPVAGRGNWPALRVTYTVPNNVLIRQRPPVIGCFDEEEKRWDTNGIDRADFDPDSRLLSFYTIKFAHIAVLQDKYLDLPLESWAMYPTGDQRVIFYLKSKHIEVEIEVTDEGCRLQRPLNPELDYLRNLKIGARSFMSKLASSGINFICPEGDDLAKWDSSTVKNNEVEYELHRDLCLVAGATYVRASKWNQTRGRDRCLFQAKESMHWVDAEREIAEAEAKGGAEGQAGAGVNDGLPADKFAVDPEAQQAKKREWSLVVYEHRDFSTEVVEEIQVPVEPEPVPEAPAQEAPAATEPAAAAEGAPGAAAEGGAAAAPTAAGAEGANAGEAKEGEAKAEGGQEQKAEATPAEGGATEAPAAGAAEGAQEAPPAAAAGGEAPAAAPETTAPVEQVPAKPLMRTERITKAVTVRVRNCFMVRGSDDATELDEEMRDDARIHPDVYNCMRDKWSPEGDARMRGAPLRFQENIRQLLNVVRPFSMH